MMDKKQWDELIGGVRQAVEGIRGIGRSIEKTSIELSEAENELSEAKRNHKTTKRRYIAILEQSTVGLLNNQYNRWKKNRAGADKTNARYAAQRELCENTAREIWAADTDHEYGKDDVIRLCYEELQREGLLLPNDRVLWRWLNDAGVIPEHARKPGRRPK